MKLLKELELTEADRAELKRIIKKESNWQIRDRAQTVLYFGDGWKAKEIAMQQDLNLDIVYDRRKNWEESEFALLPDKPRSGAPLKLTEAQKAQLAAWATEEALTAQDLVTRVQEEFQIVLHPNTLTETLKKMKFAWKRTRHSLKKSEMT